MNHGRLVWGSDTLFHTLARLAPVGIFVADLLGECVFVNERCCRMAGLPADQMRGKGWVRALHPEDRDQVLAGLNRTADEGREYTREFRFQQPAGQVIWLRCSAAVLSDEAGHKGYVGTLTDITELKRAEEMQARLVAILEATTDFVAITHAEGPASYINPAGRHLLGLAPGEQVALLDRRPEWARRLACTEVIPAALRAGQWSGESAFLARDGHEIPVSQVVVAHRTPGGTVDFFSIVARDITERKRADQEIHALNEALNRRVDELQEALARVRELQDLLPICAWCKKIRDDQNYWHEVEAYIGRHLEVRFSHGICPECFEKEKTNLTRCRTKEPPA